MIGVQISNLSNGRREILPSGSSSCLIGGPITNFILDLQVETASDRMVETQDKATHLWTEFLANSEDGKHITLSKDNDGVEFFTAGAGADSAVSSPLSVVQARHLTYCYKVRVLPQAVSPDRSNGDEIPRTM